MNDKEIFQKLGEMTANINNLQKDKEMLHNDIKNLKTDIDGKLKELDINIKANQKEINEKLEKQTKTLSDKIDILVEAHKQVTYGWKAYTLLAGMIMAGIVFVKNIIDLISK